MAAITALLAGLLFGLGLMISGMANPAKVLAFLDLAGKWDPSLALVMGGALLPGLVAFTFARWRSLSLIGLPMQLPDARHIDRRLIVGSALFGIGWGLAGICPGPALVLLGSGAGKALVFAAGLLAGMLVFEVAERARLRRAGKMSAA